MYTRIYNYIHCSRDDRRDPSRGPMHTSTAVVVVFITDVNDNKPVFKDCASYAPKIEEGAPNGSPVIKVHAEDDDKGVNGQVSLKYLKIPLGTFG